MVSKERTLATLTRGPALRRKEANADNPVSYSKVVKIEGDFIRRTPFEAETPEDCEDFDVKKYKIVGDLGNPRISLIGLYSDFVDEDFDDDDFDDDDFDDDASQPAPIPRTDTVGPAGRFITDEQLERMLNEAFANGKAYSAREQANHASEPARQLTPTKPSKPWLSTISA